MNNEYEFYISKSMQKKINMSIRAGLQRDLYPDLIVYFIRQRYSQDDEFALDRQKERKPTEYAEYDAYCESCKSEAKRILGIDSNK